MKRVNFRIHIVAFVWFAAILAPVRAQVPAAANSETVTTGGALFRIGCLGNEPDTKINAELALQLKDYLETRTAVIKSLKGAGLRGVEVRSFDTHRVLVEEMDADQVDLAFCSSLDYMNQKGNYRAVFQMRMPNDRPARGRLYHDASIFVNNRSPLFGMKKDEAQSKLAALVATSEIALVGPNSASGYIYPHLKLADLAGTAPLLIRSRNWGSSEEVVKAVINGIAQVGACDTQAVDEVLRRSGLWEHRAQLVKEVARTAKLPRDPVVVLSQWSPAHSEVGREIITGVRAFFEQLPADMPRMEPSSDEQQFFELARSVERFRALKKDRGPAL